MVGMSTVVSIVDDEWDQIAEKRAEVVSMDRPASTRAFVRYILWTEAKGLATLDNYLARTLSLHNAVCRPP